MERSTLSAPRTSPKLSPTDITPKTANSPIDRGRRLPRLVLPSPSVGVYSPSLYPGSAISRVTNPYMYPSKQQEFVGGLKDLAKSGLSIGERSTFWCYNKLSLFSRKWFTHCFLSIVLAIYTVGGAVMFVAVEGRGENLVLMDTRQLRYDLIKELRNLSIYLPDRKSDGEWEGAASNRLEKFEERLIEAYKTNAIIIGNGGGKIWTFLIPLFIAGLFILLLRDFIDVLWYRSHNLREDDWKSLARSKLRIFEEELHMAHEAGMHSYSGQRSWSFLNGVVYCLTIVTTIGYGHMYPTTTTGQALTIVYSIIGIPLFLIALTDFGKLFTRGIKFVWSYVRRVYYTGSCRKVRKTAQVAGILQGAQRVYEIATLRRPSALYSGDPTNVEVGFRNDNLTAGNTSADINTETPTTPAPSNFEIDDEFNLPISVAIFILVLYIFLGAVMYCILEQWNFFSAFYFVFISMSTIGFGDYVPRNPVCMLASIVYLIFGLALMSMCINVVQVKLSDTFKHASGKLGATIGINVNSEDGSIGTVSPGTIELPDVHAPINGVAEKPKPADGKNEDGKILKSSIRMKTEDDVIDSDTDRKRTSKISF